MMHRAPGTVLKYFLRGLLIVIPVVTTLWILWKVFDIVDRLLPLRELVPGYAVPGVGFVIIVLLVTLVGILTTNLLAAQALALADRIFARLPFVKLLYSSIKDVTEAFVSEKKKFDKPVLLSLGEGVGASVIGFVTQEDLAEFGLRDRVAVYVPQSYNFAANLLLVPRSRVTAIDKPSSEVMAFVVSGGVTSAGQA